MPFGESEQVNAIKQEKVKNSIKLTTLSCGITASTHF